MRFIDRGGRTVLSGEPWGVVDPRPRPQPQAPAPGLGPLGFARLHVPAAGPNSHDGKQRLPHNSEAVTSLPNFLLTARPGGAPPRRAFYFILLCPYRLVGAAARQTGGR